MNKTNDLKHKLSQLKIEEIAGTQRSSPYIPFVPYQPTTPKPGEAVWGTEKDGQRFFEFLKAMMINPSNISKGLQLPKFKPMGSVIEGRREGVLPMKETKIKQPLQIGPQAELNQNQLKILEGIPSNLKKLPPTERLKIMKDITGRVLKAKNKLSTPYWDDQKKIQDYLKNDDKLREKGLLGGTKKA